jgi:hypothetical protein
MWDIGFQERAIAQTVQRSMAEKLPDMLGFSAYSLN